MLESPEWGGLIITNGNLIRTCVTKTYDNSEEIANSCEVKVKNN